MLKIELIQNKANFASETGIYQIKCKQCFENTS